MDLVFNLLIGALLIALAFVIKKLIWLWRRAKTLEVYNRWLETLPTLLPNSYYLRAPQKLVDVLAIENNVITKSGYLPPGAYYHLDDLTLLYNRRLFVDQNVNVFIAGKLTVDGLLEQRDQSRVFSFPNQEA